jgi:lipoprotein-releasing system permease protein
MLSFNGHMIVAGPVLTSPDRDAMLERLRTVPGVESASAITENQAIFRANGITTGGFVRGLRPDDLDGMQYVAASLSPEARASFGQGAYGGDNVLIGQSLADSLGLVIGDPITLYSPTGADSAFGNLGGLQKTYRIGGTYSYGAADYVSAYIFMPLEQAQLFFGKEGLWDVIEMKVAEPDNVARYLEPVRAIAGPGSVVTDWRQSLAAFYGALKVERVAMSIILGLVVAIAAMNIISGIVMLVKNKGRDIAILRTIGASPSSILRVFFMAGATIGVAGTIAGLALGLLFCWNVGAIQGAIEAITGVQVFNADVYMLDAIPVLVDPLDVFWVAVWSLVMSCVASLPPSWSASRIDPVEALRYE